MSASFTTIGSCSPAISWDQRASNSNIYINKWVFEYMEFGLALSLSHGFWFRNQTNKNQGHVTRLRLDLFLSRAFGRSCMFIVSCLVAQAQKLMAVVTYYHTQPNQLWLITERHYQEPRPSWSTQTTLLNNLLRSTH